MRRLAKAILRHLFKRYLIQECAMVLTDYDADHPTDGTAASYWGVFNEVADGEDVIDFVYEILNDLADC